MIKGFALAPAVPDPGAVLRTLLGVVAIAVAAMHWGPPGSATAAAGAATIAGAVALQDSPRRRIPLVVGTSVVLGVAVGLGASVSAFSPAFVAVAAAYCFVAAMPWALGANAGLVGAASAALLVLAPPLAPTLSSTLGTAGLAVGGGLVQAGLIALWPQRRWRVQRAALAVAYRSLARDARTLADGHGDGATGVDPESLIALRAVFTAVDCQTRRRSADYRNFYGLPERIAATLTDIAADRTGRPPRELLSATAEVLGAVAQTRRSARDELQTAIDRLDRAVAEAPDPQSVVVGRLSALLHEAVAVRLGGFLPFSAQSVRLRHPEWRMSLHSALAMMAGHLNRHSPVFRHAVRLSVAVGLGCAAERYAAVPHGYWIPLTVLMVLRPETAHTYTRCVGRIAGTAAGLAMASGMLVLLDPSPATAVVLAIIFVGIAYVAAGFGYLVLSAALPAAVVFLIEMDRVGAMAADGRVFAALAGGALAVLAHVVLPDDALTRLSQRAGELLKTEVDYAAAVIKAYVHELENPTDVMAGAWQRAFRARAAFEAAAGAARLDSSGLRRWMGSYRTALNAVTASCTTLESSLPDRPGVAWNSEFVLAVDEYVESLCGDPPTAAAPWTVDDVELQAADKRLRGVVPRHGTHEGAARVLAAEVATITRNVSAITAIPAPIASG